MKEEVTYKFQGSFCKGGGGSSIIEFEEREGNEEGEAAAASGCKSQTPGDVPLLNLVSPSLNPSHK